MISPIVVVSNQKGGVWKTTTCQALLDGMVEDGYQARAVDLDPQANLTSVATYGEEVPGVYDLMHGSVTAAAWPVGTTAAAVDVDLIALRDHELGRTLPLGCLRDAVHAVQDRTPGVAPVIIDTPPSLDLLVTAGLFAADAVIIPTSASLFSSSGLRRDLEFVSGAFSDRGRSVSASTVGVVLCGYNVTRFSGRLAEEARGTYPGQGLHVFSTQVTRGGRVEELQARGSRLFPARGPVRGGHRRYRELVCEVERWLGLDAI